MEAEQSKWRIPYRATLRDFPFALASIGLLIAPPIAYTYWPAVARWLDSVVLVNV